MTGFPYTAVSITGTETDHLLWALLAVSFAVMVLVVGLLLLYAIRYREASRADRGNPEGKSWAIEISWTSATLVVFFGLFLWGADLFVRLDGVPDNAIPIYVVGKQWMWKVEHPDGQREINALHVPLGHPIELIMTSEDVIHDFAIPALRIKHDVVPGRYDTLWFQATEAGEYHLFCTQFCGTDHAAMGGMVTVMSEPDYTAWLSAQPNEGNLAALGRAVYLHNGCDGCHEGRGTSGAPPLAEVAGREESWLRDSILHPERRGAVRMPSFEGRIGEEDLAKLVAYVKSLGGGGR
ncbi:MAG TPA: cytochrome c oxidase subunit II [Magnetospirillaceae bacterium]|nr:cytochrome c oxidase subunit II [Magnetospirillaceae bacterium]